MTTIYRQHQTILKLARQYGHVDNSIKLNGKAAALLDAMTTLIATMRVQGKGMWGYHDIRLTMKTVGYYYDESKEHSNKYQQKAYWTEKKQESRANSTIINGVDIFSVHSNKDAGWRELAYQLFNVDKPRVLWVKLANQYHPDRGGDVKVMQRINALYDVVK